MEEFQKIVFSSERVIRSGRKKFLFKIEKRDPLGEFLFILAIFPTVREIFTTNGFRHVLLLSGWPSLIFLMFQDVVCY
jgi:hypothetical protein